MQIYIGYGFDTNEVYNEDWYNLVKKYDKKDFEEHLRLTFEKELIDIDEEDTNNNPGSISMTDQDWNKEQNKIWIESKLNWMKDTQETPIKEPDPKDDEDYQNRVKIFKSF